MNNMRRSLWTVLAALTVAVSMGRATQLDVAGQWDITLKTQVGETAWTATFEQDGETVSGEVDLGDREVFPLDGTVEGDTIAFVFVMPDLDGDQPINLSGTVTGNTITGDEGYFSWYGAGDWTGVKRVDGQ